MTSTLWIPFSTLSPKTVPFRGTSGSGALMSATKASTRSEAFPRMAEGGRIGDGPIVPEDRPETLHRTRVIPQGARRGQVQAALPGRDRESSWAPRGCDKSGFLLRPPRFRQALDILLHVEIVLGSALRSPRDREELSNPPIDDLHVDVLNDGLVHHRRDFLGLGLLVWNERRAESCDWEDRLHERTTKIIAFYNAFHSVMGPGNTPHPNWVKAVPAISHDSITEIKGVP